MRPIIIQWWINLWQSLGSLAFLLTRTEIAYGETFFPLYVIELTFRTKMFPAYHQPCRQGCHQWTLTSACFLRATSAMPSTWQAYRMPHTWWGIENYQGVLRRISPSLIQWCHIENAPLCNNLQSIRAATWRVYCDHPRREWSRWVRRPSQEASGSWSVEGCWHALVFIV